MEISRKSDDIVVLARSFIAAHLHYTGDDTIPSDKSCAFYDDDWASRNTVIPGNYDTAKVSLPVKQLAHLGKGAAVAPKHMGLGENTEFPSQQECASTFGTPHLCIINKQSLDGTFRWVRIK